MMRNLPPILFSFCISLATTLSNNISASEAPAGFTPLFNEKDLTGWWGADTEDPRKYMALSPEDFQKKHDKSLDDIQKHWRVEGTEQIGRASCRERV